MNLSKLQEIVKDRGAWPAIVHRVSESQTQLSDWFERVHFSFPAFFLPFSLPTIRTILQIQKHVMVS